MFQIVPLRIDYTKSLGLSVYSAFLYAKTDIQKRSGFYILLQTGNHNEVICNARVEVKFFGKYKIFFFGKKYKLSKI